MKTTKIQAFKILALLLILASNNVFALLIVNNTNQALTVSVVCNTKTNPLPTTCSGSLQVNPNHSVDWQASGWLEGPYYLVSYYETNNVGTGSTCPQRLATTHGVTLTINSSSTSNCTQS